MWWTPDLQYFGEESRRPMNNKQIGSISARVTKRNKNGPAAVLKQRTFDLVPPAVFCSCPILGSSRIKKISQHSD
ncbi:unnamed protein product [Tenebrio molitor]|nr:unnamed protein product [Tenebrio molitor]